MWKDNWCAEVPSTADSAVKPTAKAGPAQNTACMQGNSQSKDVTMQSFHQDRRLQGRKVRSLCGPQPQSCASKIEFTRRYLKA
jgi:hypothetical protein